MPMDRLTKKIPNMPAVPVKINLDFVFGLDDETWYGLSAIFERLAEYEDTGMTPEKIMAMRDERDRLLTDMLT